jgi:hypothetical protein
MMMQGVTAILTGATVNILAGLLYEYCPLNARVDFYLVGDAAGELRATIITGNNAVMAESPISRAARFPLKPDDFTMNDVVRAGEKMTINVRNTGAGTNSIFFAVDIKPLGR